MIAHGRAPGRRWSGEAVAVGIFAAVQTFAFFTRQDRFSVLLWWTRDSWLYVTVLWLKDLFLAAVAFLVFAEVARATVSFREETEPHDRKANIRHAVLFALILAAGVALRWLAPRQIPPGVWADALFEAEGALRTSGHIPWLGGRPLDVEGLRNSALVSNLYLKFCALLFRVFGRGDTGILSLSAVGGTLALPAIYWLGREIGSRRRALAAMAILAFARWPLIFSRWAWTASLLLPLVLAAAAATVRATRTGHWKWAAAAGLFVGLSLHTYVSAWAIAAGFGAFAFLQLRLPNGRRLAFAGAVVAFVAFLPFGVAFLEYPDRIGGRAQDVSFLAPTKDVSILGGNRPGAPAARLLYNVVEYSGLFLWTRDPNPRDGLPERPLVDPLLGLAALTGSAISLRKARCGDAGYRLVATLAVAGLAAGILGNPGGAPNALRVFPLAGPFVLWAAEASDRWISAVRARFSVSRGAVLGLAASLLFSVETVPFLAAWPESPLVVGSFCAPETASGRLRRQLGNAPTIVEPTALAWPIVFETLAASEDPSHPVPRLPRRTAADLVRSAPDGPFWYVARERDLEILRRASWRCPTRRAMPTDRTAVFRVVPPPV